MPPTARHRRFCEAVGELSRAHAAGERADRLIFTRLAHQRFLKLGFAKSGDNLHEVRLTQITIGSGKGSHWRKHWMNFTDSDWREVELLVQTGRAWRKQNRGRIVFWDRSKRLVAVVKQDPKGRRGLSLVTAFRTRSVHYFNNMKFR